MLKNKWTEAWEAEDAPDPLGMPLQGMVSSEPMSRVHRYPAQAQQVAFNPVGQNPSWNSTRKVSCFNG